MSTMFVETPIRYGGVITFETVASVRDVYEVRKPIYRFITKMSRSYWTII